MLTRSKSHEDHCAPPRPELSELAEPPCRPYSLLARLEVWLWRSRRPAPRARASALDPGAFVGIASFKRYE